MNVIQFGNCVSKSKKATQMARIHLQNQTKITI